MANPYALDNPGGYVSNAPPPPEQPVQGSDGYWYLHGQRVAGPGGALPQSQAGGLGSANADIAAIIQKHDAGTALSPYDQARYDAHMQEANARLNGGGGAANGPPGSGFYAPGNPGSIGALAGATQFAVDPGGHLPVEKRINEIGSAGAAPGMNTPASAGGTGAMAGGAGTTTGVDPNVAAILEEARRNQAKTLGYVEDTLVPRNDAWNAGIGAAYGGIQNTITGQRTADDWLGQQYAGMLGTQAGNAAKYNALDTQALADYQGVVSNANARDDQNLAFLQGAYDNTSQLSPTHQVANAQAVLANYQTAGLTLAQYQTAQLFQASLERAQQNPNDVKAQQDVLALSRQISEGSLDMQNGGLTPEAKQAQLSALEQYGSLTKPQITDEERFIYEKQRLAEEQDQDNARAGVLGDLRARGMSGSGMELGNMLQSSQITSQNRLLGDLGAGAQAQQRAMQALAGYGGLSSTMMQQGNDVARGNVNARLSGLGVRAGMSNELARNSQALSQFNAGEANTTSRFNAAEAGATSRFNAGAYNAKEIANAGFSNQNAQFNANAYNQASITNANNGTNVNINNMTQNMIQGRFEDSFKADQQSQAWGRATDIGGFKERATGAYAQRGQDLFTGTERTSAGNYGRDLNTINLWGQGATNVHNATTSTNNTQIGALGGLAGQYAGAAGRDLSINGQRIGAAQAGSNAVTAGLGQVAGDAAANRAIASIQGGGSNNWNPLEWFKSA